jgi:hypothetical protein
MNYQETDWYKARLATIAARSLTGKGDSANRIGESANRNDYQRNLMRVKRGKLDPELFEEAKLRAERAANYAKKMPEQIKGGEDVFSTIDWQLDNLTPRKVAA